MKIVPTHQARKLQPVKQRIQRIIVYLPHQIAFRGKLHRRVFPDGREVIRQVCLLAVALELFADRLLDFRQMLVNAVQCTVGEQKLRCRLGSDTANSRNVVRTVPHQAFEVDQPRRLEAVFRAEHIRGIVGRDGLPGFRRHQLYRHVLAYELQRIPVSRNDHAVVALARTDLAHRAQNVVCLPAFALIDGNVHCAENLFHQRHLHCQLLGHRMARRLVAVVSLMAEGRCLEIKCHAKRVRLLVGAQSL